MPSVNKVNRVAQALHAVLQAVEEHQFAAMWLLVGFALALFGFYLFKH